MSGEQASAVFELIQHFVFWSSVATLFLAAVERSVRKFYPDSRAEKVLAFITDLVSQFGALNLRSQIAPEKREPWTEEERKQKNPIVPPPA